MGDRCFIIAEIGINHNGDLNLAKETIMAAQNAGVDAVKFQTFKAEEFINDEALTYTYESQGREITESQIKMFKRYEFSLLEWEEIFEFCKKANILCFTTPQNKGDLDFILSIADPPIIKVGSDDLTNLELLKYYASKNIPMIISTGMSYEEEISDAIEAIRETGNKNLTVLHCISTYPTEDEDVNMKKMLKISNDFNIPVGFSDHTRGELASIVAATLGATVIEKHFTLNKKLPGPDHKFSANPAEMKRVVDSIRRVERIMGSSLLVPTPKEKEMREIARRSIVTNKELSQGHILCREDLDFKRPGTGLSPKKIDDILGHALKVDKKANEIILYEEISK